MEALERRALEAEMATLQAQIEPHFLFNTLALIGQLIETDPEQASVVHSHLIKYLRAALPQIREQGGGKLRSTNGTMSCLPQHYASPYARAIKLRH